MFDVGDIVTSNSFRGEMILDRPYPTVAGAWYFKDRNGHEYADHGYNLTLVHKCSPFDREVSAYIKRELYSGK